VVMVVGDRERRRLEDEVEMMKGVYLFLSSGLKSFGVFGVSNEGFDAL
jgi:hypothetical protein